MLYGKVISQAKWLCLIPVIGGVCLASIKELDFSVAALAAACIANVFAAFRANENKKLMDTEGLADRIGSTGNQFAISTILGTLCMLPVFLLSEGAAYVSGATLLVDGALGLVGYPFPMADTGDVCNFPVYGDEAELPEQAVLRAKL